MTKLDYLNRAIAKHKTVYRFCKVHNFNQSNISKVIASNAEIGMSIAIVRAIADDLATSEDERVKIIGEILK